MRCSKTSSARRRRCARTSRSGILLAHPKRYLEAIKAARPAEGEDPVRLDPDTVLSSTSWEPALRAVGAGLHAVDQVLDPSSGIRKVFCQIRPCGHHAEKERAMGFCIFNNIAIAGLYAREKHGVERVAVVDFDVHHGNGTQDIFWSDKDLFFASTHQMPLYPGTGAESETGVGNIFNAPLGRTTVASSSGRRCARGSCPLCTTSRRTSF